MSRSRKNEISTESAHALRRQQLLENMEEKSIAIVLSNPIAHRNGDVEYTYHQDSNFFYLTGFNEPESIAILAPGRKDGEFILFNRQNDPKQETWTGKRAGQEGAREVYGADQAYPIEKFKDMLPGLLKGRTEVFYPINNNHKDKTILESIKKAAKKSIQLSDIEPTLNDMRQIKDDSEIGLIKKSIEISEKAHLRAMHRCKPGLYEYQLESELMHEFFNNGARALAYPNIVASGENSCTLHYDENSRQIKDGDLVLIDAGAEYKNYSADITRTFPANGKFTKEQRAIYELVLEAQKAGILAIEPGSDWTIAEATVDVVLTRGLMKLGILNGDLDELLEKRASKEYYMHGSGHWMGLDVHDSGPYVDNSDEPIAFKPGMILTMEPGIYIKPSPKVDKRWHNIGVRIEDDVLVTEEGCEVLSGHLPKEADEIEAIMAEAHHKNLADAKKSQNTHANTSSTTAKSLTLLVNQPANPAVKLLSPTVDKPTSSVVLFPKAKTQGPVKSQATVEADPIARRLRSRK